jgi:hypothetical protein
MIGTQKLRNISGLWKVKNYVLGESSRRKIAGEASGGQELAWARPPGGGRSVAAQGGGGRKNLLVRW